MRFPRAIFLCALLVAPLVFALEKDDEYSDEAWMREGLRRQSEKFKRLTLIPNPDDKNLVAAHCETALSWWGDLRVFHRTGDKVDWIAKLPTEYVEGRGTHLLSFEWRYLPSLKFWVLEVFDSTHMGNGSFWLFALDGHDMRLLMHTPAKGEFALSEFTRARYPEPHLEVEYTRLNGEKHSSVVLSGVVATSSKLDETPLSKFRYSETWKWDAGQRVFLRSQSARSKAK